MKFSIALVAGVATVVNALAMPNFFSTMPELEKRSDELASRTLNKRTITYTALVTDGATFINGMTTIHNQYRSHHGVGNLVWSDTLAQKAASTAQGCVFQHSAVHTYGENVGAGSVQFNNPAYFVYLWYNEIQQYNYSAPGYASATGHFTQVIWKSSTQLGCAWVQGCAGAPSPSYPQMVWCEYSPSGNVLPANPYFINNVLVPIASPAAPAIPPYHT